MKNVCIIGSGSWGCALAIHAAKIGHNVKIWSFAQKEADLINKERKCIFCQWQQCLKIYIAQQI